MYDAWGNLISSTGNTENSYLYCGEQLDSVTGLYYLRARYMDPTTGTFTTMDTYQGSLFDPTSLHKYLYANANPVMNVDPSGYFAAMYAEAQPDSWAVSTGQILLAKIRTIFAQAVSTYIPAMMTAATGFAIFAADSPALMDVIARIANGDISINSAVQEINELIVRAQQFAEQVSNFVNRANNSSGSGGSGNFDPNDLKDFIVRAGKNLKDHYIRHKQLLENITGKKYPKWKQSNNAEEFLQDIQQII